MADFQTYTLDTVKPEGKAILEGVNESYGFVPNLLGTMIEAPATAAGYLALGKLFGETTFSPTEQQVISLTVSRLNGCDYCVAAHSTVAGLQDVPADVVEAIREDQPIADPKLEALRQLTAQLAEQRGWLENEQVGAFFAAGYGKQQVFEVVLGVSMKTISNYINHIAGTELDEAFAAQQWQAPGTVAA
jgi:uncharacterized peroxidase-related enzyme